MNLRALAVLLPLLLPPILPGAQSAGDQKQAEETQLRGYWTDPVTGLTWAGRDNGSDVKWKQAVRYCRDVRSGGYDDWRLANLDELQSIYDKSIESPGLMGAKQYHNVEPATWHVRGGLFLTGNDWTSDRIPDDRGRPSGYAWRYDFNEGRAFDGDELSFAMGKRALCVRGVWKRGLHTETTGHFRDIRA